MKMFKINATAVYIKKCRYFVMLCKLFFIEMIYSLLIFAALN
ncbi:hypothetical protein SAMN05216331_10264 [Porphyromonadaceae bacterium KH3R12]|nr:hypothetical protein SAMN05216331_10264 [Porphyromonadaceae bacterium KH3R12]